MKLKGISIFERHAEKIVLGVFAAAALGVIGFQFTRPTLVKVDNQDLPPERAYAKISERAQAIDSRLRDPNPAPSALELKSPDVLALMDERMRAAIAPSRRLAASPGMPATTSAVEGVQGTELPRVAPLVPPTPGAPVAGVFGATIDPIVVERTPALRPLVPAQQPYDLRAVSVRADFDSAAMVRMLETDPDGAGPMRAPPGYWWKGRMEILDVVLERQTRQDDGSWSEAQAVPPAPGLATLREHLAGDPGANFAEVVRIARERRRDIVHPPFYATIAGEAWSPPEAPASGPVAPVTTAAEVRTLQRELERLDKDIERLKTDREKAPERKQGPAGGGGGVRGGGGGMAMRGSPRSIVAPAFGRMLAQAQTPPTTPAPGDPAEPKKKTPDEIRKEAIEKSLKARETERERIVARLKELGADPDAPKDAPQAPRTGRAIPEPKPIESREAAMVWAHDVTVVPGATYRYRVRLAVTNPLYGNARQMHADSHALAASPALVSEPSEWSAPVTVDPDGRVFFTSAFAQEDQAGALGGPDSMGASAEIWKFHYGYWRRAKVTLRPGDAIAASVTLPEGFARVWEVEPPAEGQTREVVVTEKPAPAEALVDAGGFLLDVAPVALGSQGQAKSLQVVFRDARQRLVTRWPDADAVSPDRRRLEASEAAGAGVTAPRKPGAFADSEGRAIRAPGEAPAPGEQPSSATPATPSAPPATGAPRLGGG